MENCVRVSCCSCIMHNIYRNHHTGSEFIREALMTRSLCPVPGDWVEFIDPRQHMFSVRHIRFFILFGGNGLSLFTLHFHFFIKTNKQQNLNTSSTLELNLRFFHFEAREPASWSCIAVLKMYIRTTDKELVAPNAPFSPSSEKICMHYIFLVFWPVDI